MLLEKACIGGVGTTVGGQEAPFRCIQCRQLDPCSFCVQAFGLGSVAQVVTGQGAFGQYISINIAFGLAVAMGTYVGGKVSGMSADPLKCVDLTCSSPAADRVLISFPGAHMNGAVSFTMCVFGRLTWKMLPLYICAQLLGSFLASGTIYAIYYGKDFPTYPHTIGRVS